MSGCAAARNFVAVVSVKMQTPSTLSQRGQNCGAIRFRIHRTARAFQLPRRVVAVDADEQRVAEVSRVLQIGHVAEMQDVETAVRDDEFFAGGAELLLAIPAICPKR